MKSPLRSIALGAVVVGSFDLAYAITYWFLDRGVPPIRICQSVATGVLGPASFKGGIPTAILGVALHYFIALGVVTVYWIAARSIAALARHPIPFGSVYGIGVYLVMNYVVIPLSLAKRPAFILPWVVASVIVHMFLIGVPAALFASLAVRARLTQPGTGDTVPAASELTT